MGNRHSGFRRDLSLADSEGAPGPHSVAGWCISVADDDVNDNSGCRERIIICPEDDEWDDEPITCGRVRTSKFAQTSLLMPTDRRRVLVTHSQINAAITGWLVDWLLMKMESVLTIDGWMKKYYFWHPIEGSYANPMASGESLAKVQRGGKHYRITLLQRVDPMVESLIKIVFQGGGGAGRT